ncbi:MAG: tRNA (adenosine(37)-N6)-dimethylallyltransferase MiaA [Firmicutes bacterium]|nr:tRNA (adenosine(37)-N6)-dimethylallyltransferase MiaA [Bacillota bacterium]
MDEGDSRAVLPLLVIAGPTAVGKTELSLRVAEALDGEIVSADSAAVYRGMDIGAAKVSLMDRKRVPHHLIDVVDARETFSVADFQRLASVAVREVLGRGRLPILVGGTGLWIRALIRDYRLPAEAGRTPIRARLESVGERDGFAALRRQLRVVDPDSYQAIQPNDHRRLVRALEVFQATGNRLQRATDHPSPYRPVYWVLTRSIAELHQRIEERTQTMMSQGLVEEVSRLLEHGVPPRSQSLMSIGYRETMDWFYGLLTTEERDRLIVRHTQQYAKRQLTWFRSEKDARWLDLSAWPLGSAIDKIVQSVRESGYRQNT